ncbi:cystathionine gamma-synthase [Pontibacter sp. BT310]|uniref:Cystathionine gamma-synthase n=1 Tax=Pontibacter populi TaxID=890055 RepID=A0ABS6XED2_9BACT|nr:MULTISPECIES: cystathionine gamma-synthase [Pontibacter]MBJ6119492.1 cystathionine gamma-synthase [Pontibacter sp. BT310]MBR0571920.1 cystathionine gamma-synthase [Microvirga sp. STS03]MBW3366346.1 cystathionine gamma-synthase [Pontibacter populi]
MKFGTKAIHAGVEPDPTTGAIMTPIYQTSTYVQKSPGDHKGYEYSRTHNPTRTQLQNALAALENGKHGLCFASGMAAIDAVIKMLAPGDEVISTNDLYGGSYRIFTKIFQNYGIKFHFTNMADLSKVEALVNENTKMIWVETPTNPLLNIIDIKGCAAIAKKHNLLLVADNTFATPYLQTPLDLGADIVMHSLTKYMGGHSDVVMGALIVNNDDLHERLAFIQNACGGTPGPQDCFLLLRGLKTLHLRMERHCQNGRKIAEYLRNHAKVEKVFWPGFEDHNNHSVAKEQMNDFGGMISFVLKGDKVEDATRVLEKLKFFALAESLGGVESLCGHPATMTHASIPREERMKAGLSDSLIRLSVGVEDAEDLIADLEQAIG